MRPAVPRSRVWATAIPTCWPPCTPRSTSWPMRIPASSPPKWPRNWREHLISRAPQGMSHAYFVSGGSEAIEAAMKMARQYFVESGQPQRTPFHRAPAELSRQYAGRLVRGRQPMAARALRAHPDPGDARLALLSPIASRDPRKRRSSTALRLARELEAAIVRPGQRQGDRVRRRDGRRRHGRRAARRCPATSRQCAKSATATACC